MPQSISRKGSPVVTQGKASGAHETDKHEKAVIGWLETVDFPEWSISGIRAKVDTGARTSALHVEDLTIGRNNVAHFVVVLSRNNTQRRVQVTAPVVRMARVRSSTGHYSMRCFVRTLVHIGHVTKEIDISLVSREKMLFRMLLGRKALEKDFLVDVTKRHVITEKPRTKKRSTR